MQLKILNEFTQNPDIIKFMHDAKTDTKPLQQTLGIGFRNVLDTQVLYAAIYLDYPQIGFAAMVKKALGGELIAKDDCKNQNDSTII